MSLTSRYYYPKVHDVAVYRDDPNFIVTAMRTYCPVYVEGETTLLENSCQIRCRYRSLPDGEFSEWTTILAADDLTAEAVVAPVYADLIESESYEVVVGVLDAAGNEASTSIILPSTDVFMEKDGELNSISIGEGITEEDTVSVAEKLTVKVKGKLNAGTLYVGGTRIEAENCITMTGINSSLQMMLPYSETQGTGSVMTTLFHQKAGEIAISCHPAGEDGTPGTLEITMWNNGADTELKLGAVEDRVLLTGLTEPVDDGDAVNKAYVDALIARIQALEEKLGL